MTDARITQGVRLVAGGGPGEARITQGARLTIGKVPAPARITQGVRLAVSKIDVDARITSGVRLTIASAVPCATKWQQLWRIKRRDGFVFAFTSLDEDFEWRGDLYEACNSLTPSAAQSQTNLGGVGSMELSGIIDHHSIRDADIYGGKFDDAFIEVWLVPYEGTDVPKRLASGWTGNLSQGEQGYTMEVVGAGARLGQQPLVKSFTPSCRWVFGSPQCGVDIEALKILGTVTSARNRNQFTGDVGDADSASRQWVDGRIRWTSGENEGYITEIRDIEFATGGGVNVLLWVDAPYAPGVGDTFDLLPGCDLIKTGGCTLYANVINFGGFAEVPGGDAVQAVPDAS